MKTRIQNIARVAIFAFLTLLGVHSNRAATTDTVFTQDFSSGQWPPANWTDNSYAEYSGGDGWYWASDGVNGDNGSAICDIWDGSNGFLLTPQTDASQWNPNDSVFVDFDFFWEYNYYNEDYGSAGDDNFQAYLVNSGGQQQVLNLYTSTDYTYFNASYNDITNPPEDPSDWRHYHIAIPPGYRTSDLQIAWQGVPNYGLGNAAIDNVMISGTHYNILTVAPNIPINFGTVSVGDTSGYRTILLSNPNPVAIDISNVAMSNPDFQVAYAASSVAAGTSLSPGIDSIVIFYTPSVGGVETGNLSFNTGADEPQADTISLTGTGVTPLLSIGSPNLFVRTTTRLGDSISQSIVVTNSGVGLLKILPSSNIGGDYPAQYFISRLPAMEIPAGMSDTVTVTFTPLREGLDDAILYIESNGGEDSIPLLGVGILPHIVVTPSTFSFPAIAIGQQECQQFTISNPGSDTLVIANSYLDGSDPDFSYTGLSGKDTLIPPGQSATVNVCFTPVRTGTRLATLQIFTNIPQTYSEPPLDTGLLTVQITGIGGISTGLVFATPAIDSAAVGATNCVMDTLWNFGPSAATVTSGGFGDASTGNFSFADQAFPVTIPAGAYTLISVCYTPSASGVDSNVATVFATTTTSSETDTTETASTVVIGAGLYVCSQASTTALFDSSITLVGSTAIQNVTITNCGDLPMSYTGMLSDSTDYAIAGSATTALVQPGGTATFSIEFLPLQRVMLNATLTVTGAEGLTPIVVMLSGTGGGVTALASGAAGSVAQGNCQNFNVMLTNQGNMDWTPNAAMISGTNSADFTIVTQPPTTVAAGDSAAITLQFCPSTDSSEMATLTFPNASPTPAPGFSYALTGVGTASADVAMSVASNGFTLEQNYPNPTNGMATIAFTTPADCQLQIDLIDAKGALVQTIAIGFFASGEHTAPIDASKIASGSYFCVLTNGSTRLMRQIEVVK